MEEFLEQIKKAIENKLYLVALQSTLIVQNYLLKIEKLQKRLY